MAGQHTHRILEQGKKQYLRAEQDIRTQVGHKAWMYDKTGYRAWGQDKAQGMRAEQSTGCEDR